jgi:hypothetical protein
MGGEKGEPLSFKTRCPIPYIIFQPFIPEWENMPTWIIILLYFAWCFVVIHFDLYTMVPDVSGPFSVLGTTIAVTLPLLASSAVNRNKESLFNYNAFCGDVLALGWEILSYVRDPKEFTVSKPNALKIQQAFEICLILPTVVKWKFRNNAEFDIDKVYMLKNYEPDLKGKKEESLPANREPSFGMSGLMDRTKKRKAVVELSTLRSVSTSSQRRRRASMVNYVNIDGDSMGRKFTDTSIGREYMSTLLQMGGKIVDGKGQVGIDKCDLIFVFLFDLISEFEISDTRKNMITRTVERVYSSYGNMGNITGYKLPLMYKTYMYIAISLFMVVFPFTYGTSGGNLKNYDIIGVNETFWNAQALYKDETHTLADRETDIFWHGLIVIYFLFGMHLMTIKVANAFKSSSEAVGFSTVGDSESSTNTSLHNMYKKRMDLQKNMKMFPKNFDEMPSSPGGEEKTALLRRKRLYV